MDIICKWWVNLSESWQIGIFSVTAPFLIGLGIYLFKKILSPSVSANIVLADDLSKLSKQIREMLAEYTIDLEKAEWKPHLPSSNRETASIETGNIQAQIDQKFKKHYQHDSYLLLKRASNMLSRTDFEERTQVLTGHFLLNEYCDYLNEIAEELRLL